MSNGNKKYASKAGELKETDCHSDLKTLQIIDKKEGEIFLLDNVNFGIHYKGNTMPLLPCNLPAALQKAGKKIIFSGAIKETKPEELWAGTPFVLTKAEEK
ncbi:hypothetical protein [Ferruginibacter profundus]